MSAPLVGLRRGSTKVGWEREKERMCVCLLGGRAGKDDSPRVLVTVRDRELQSFVETRNTGIDPATADGKKR
jgi:hypothetical protein